MATESAQQGSAQTFDAGRFGRWLRMMLVSFYTDEEAAVADALYRQQAMMKDVSLARALQLPDRQVRQVLERRLVPDCIVDRCSEGTGDKLQTFYRISPVAVAVAAQRFQLLEMSLSAQAEEQYVCNKCNRVYDTMQAMSTSFLCDCGQALASTAEESEVRRDRLHRFHVQCKDLLKLTQELENLPGPQFGHPPKVKKPRGAAKQSAKAKAATSSEQRPAPADDFRANQTQVDMASTLQSKDSEDVQVPPAETAPALSAEQEISKTLEEEVSAQNQSTRSSLEARLRGTQRSQPQMVHEDPVVVVRGQPLPLSRVLADDDLQEQMTDQEYQSFYDVDRNLQHRKLRSLLS
mmetsp:Transcript_65819/g.154031  ORF Transcript_65819/g.154031 Transcript_65819/m.154031 type:complete len:350 (+) Transcript_65819:62-1111(+)